MNRIFLVLCACFFYMASMAQRSLTFSAGALGVHGRSSNPELFEEDYHKYGYGSTYGIDLAFPLSKRISILGGIGQDFVNFPKFVDVDSIEFIPGHKVDREMLINFFDVNLLSRYALGRWSLDLGYGGKYIITRAGSTFDDGEIGVSYGYEWFIFHATKKAVVPNWQHSLVTGANYDIGKVRLGLHYTKFIPNYFETRGKSNYPRKYFTLEYVSLSIGYTLTDD